MFCGDDRVAHLHNSLCCVCVFFFVYVLCLVFSLWPVSLDCSILIAVSDISIVIYTFYSLYNFMLYSSWGLYCPLVSGADLTVSLTLQARVMCLFFFVYVLCLVFSMLPVSLDCSILIAVSDISIVIDTFFTVYSMSCCTVLSAYIVQSP